MATRTWFITGASRGFGRQWTTAALRRGDQVAAAARTPAALDDLVAEFGDAVFPVQLDTTSGRASCIAAVERAHERFGQLDIIINNAGYGQNGMIEEITEAQAQAQFDTNVFGPMWITQGALPFLREQGSGHIINVSSIAGIASFPGLGMYCSSKWALEGWTQALAAEVADFGIKVTLIEPGGFDTDAGSNSYVTEPMEAYEAFREKARALAAQRRSVLGDPKASAEAVMRIVDAETPPLRVFFGSQWLGVAEQEYERRIAAWREVQDLAELSQGFPAP
jgi:NAD(P)-dependent dehydrogenase (short-subunit alcohol dehydrogenase family)